MACDNGTEYEDPSDWSEMTAIAEIAIRLAYAIKRFSLRIFIVIYEGTFFSIFFFFFY